MPKLLFIIGMQKSGTSLLNRMLMNQSVVKNPFLPEGKFFWGDNPPFNPVDAPCGELFQKHLGSHGHFLNSEDFDEIHRKLLLDRIKHAEISEPILMNKNPYNSVRIEWLKKIFPECSIVAMVRNPLANVYSLLKKYQLTDNELDDGWWGIKPKNWKSFVNDNKVEQCSHQWNEVNKEILTHFDKIDLVINYDDLCRNPNKLVSESIKLCSINHQATNLVKCKNFNNEYKVGSRLLSKNKELKRIKSFDLSNLNESLEFPSLEQDQINCITEICNKTWFELKASAKQ